MLCENVPECISNTSHLNTSLEQYYYSVQIIVEQDCSFLESFENNTIFFELDNVYPNPFNPTTTINFSLKKSEKISVTIYDLKGQLIKTIINNKLINTGTHNLLWDASPSLILFSSIAIHKAKGIDAETQFPYLCMIFITFCSLKPPNFE